MKEELLSLIPNTEEELISDLSKASDKYQIIQVIIDHFGHNEDEWSSWQSQVRDKYFQLRAEEEQ